MFTAFRLLFAAGLFTMSLTAAPVLAGVNLATVAIDQFPEIDDE
jgi:hypothetical protein